MQPIRSRTGAARSIFVLSAVLTAFTLTNQARAQDAEPEAISSLVEQRALVQEGLSIGLASSLLQTRLAMFEENRVGACTRLEGGSVGSVKDLSRTGSRTNYTTVVEVYYDNRCTDRYVHASLHVQLVSSKPTVGKITETSTFTGPTGANLGTLKMVQTLTQAGANRIQLSGTGSFKPASGPAADIGYDCDGPVILVATGTMKCQIGVAQTFAAVHADLASITAATLKIANISGANFKATFTASGNMRQGASGALGISAQTATSLKITGANTAVGTTTVTGKAARYAVFPPGPTSWTSTDTGHKAVFSISMPANKTSFTGTIKKTTGGAALATFTVDKSGSGQITYSNNVKAAISAWVLSN